jgi:hypothetical protein
MIYAFSMVQALMYNKPLNKKDESLSGKACIGIPFIQQLYGNIDCHEFLFDYLVVLSTTHLTT